MAAAQQERLRQTNTKKQKDVASFGLDEMELFNAAL
jgi:hypothetical protein